MKPSALTFYQQLGLENQGIKMNKLLTTITILLLVIILAEVYFIGIKPLNNNNSTTKNTPNQQIKVNDPDKQTGINNIVKLLDQKNFKEFEFFRTLLVETKQNNYESLTLIKQYRGQLEKIDISSDYLDPKSQLSFALKFDLINTNTNQPLVIYYQEEEIDNIKAYRGEEPLEISEINTLPKGSDLLITEEYNFGTSSLNKATITVL